jgi:hypothetical protein
MVRIRRQQAEGCGTKARWQGLGRNFRAGPGSNESAVLEQMENALGPSINRENRRRGKWPVVEDTKLKDAVQRHGGKDWVANSALVSGRTKKQCCRRWKDVMDLSIDRVNGRTGKRTAVEDSKLKDAVQLHGGKDEDSKLKDAVQMHGGKDGGAISALIPG